MFLKLLFLQTDTADIQQIILTFEANVTLMAFFSLLGSIRETIFINHYIQSLMVILKRALSEKFIKNREH